MKRVLRIWNYFTERRYLSSHKGIEDITEVRTEDKRGRGVYASEIISPGVLLGVYPGKRITIDEFFAKETFVKRSLRYAYYISSELVLDPTDIFGYLPDVIENRLALINEPIEGESVNVLPINSYQFVWYVCIRKIFQGEQLLTTYGSLYERGYKSAMVHTEGKCEIDQETKNILMMLSKRYTWLKVGVSEYID